MPKIAGFMHVATTNHWREVVADQLEKIGTSGLAQATAELFVIIAGEDVLPESLARLSGPKVRIRRVPDVSYFEFPALSAIHQYALKNDGLVWYLHTKGCSRERDPCVEDWRALMEYFVIERWRVAVETLASADVCGVNWHEEPWRHFSGNFWWARSDYVRTLPSVHTLNLADRFEAESWLGRNPAVLAKSLFDSKVNHYDERFPRELYAAAR